MPNRLLLVTADDFGISPGTTQGILDAARVGAVSSSVLLVNSPHAEAGVAAWEAAGRPVELGWHPCLTLDRPVLPPERVPSLVDEAGKFLPLGTFLKRIVLGRLVLPEVEAEFRAQFQRFLELVGQPPVNVNAHHHVHVFRAVLEPLMAVLDGMSPRPLVRRVVESLRTLRGVSGARPKRLFLALRGRLAARSQAAGGFPGNQSLLGVTDPQFVSDPDFFLSWLRSSRGEFVELACHPGHEDRALDGRDDDPELRRPHELERLLSPGFLAAVEEAGFRLVTAGEVVEKGLSIPGAARPSRRKSFLPVSSRR